jgi:K+-transporting ATPase c subunit
VSAFDVPVAYAPVKSTEIPLRTVRASDSGTDAGVSVARSTVNSTT